VEGIFACVECVNSCTDWGGTGIGPPVASRIKLRVFELSFVRQYGPKRLSGDRSQYFLIPLLMRIVQAVEIVSFGAVDIVSQSPHEISSNPAT
jgi:hypothetical protein